MHRAKHSAARDQTCRWSNAERILDALDAAQARAGMRPVVSTTITMNFDFRCDSHSDDGNEGSRIVSRCERYVGSAGQHRRPDLLASAGISSISNNTHYTALRGLGLHNYNVEQIRQYDQQMQRNRTLCSCSSATTPSSTETRRKPRSSMKWQEFQKLGENFPRIAGSGHHPFFLSSRMMSGGAGLSCSVE